MIFFWLVLTKHVNKDQDCGPWAFLYFLVLVTNNPFRRPSVSKTDEFLLTLGKKDKLDYNLVLNKSTDIFNLLSKLLKEFEGKDSSFQTMSQISWQDFGHPSALARSHSFPVTHLGSRPPSSFIRFLPTLTSGDPHAPSSKRLNVPV